MFSWSYICMYELDIRQRLHNPLTGFCLLWPASDYWSRCCKRQQFWSGENYIWRKRQRPPGNCTIYRPVRLVLDRLSCCKPWSLLQVLLQIEEKLFEYVHQAVFRKDNGRAVRLHSRLFNPIQKKFRFWLATVLLHKVINDTCKKGNRSSNFLFLVNFTQKTVTSPFSFLTAFKIWQRSHVLSWCHQGRGNHLSTQVRMNNLSQ